MHESQRSIRETTLKLGAPLWAGLLALAAACPALGQDGTGFRFPQLTLLHWLLFFGVFVAFWVLFYYILYPYFLWFYDPSYSKVLFWSLFLFYAMTWLHLSTYLVFDIGFYYSWARWVAVVLTGLWLLWFVAVLVRGRRA